VHEPTRHPRRPRLVVIGAGVAGLYAARAALDHDAEVTVVEARDRVGGLTAEHLHGGNVYDLGVHMLHEQDGEVLARLRSVLGDERIEVRLDARISWLGARHPYPLDLLRLLRTVPLRRTARFGLGFLGARLRGLLTRQSPPRDAEHALIDQYGAPLYRAFFAPFTERFWGRPPSALSAHFVHTSMPRLTAAGALARMASSLGFDRPHRGPGKCPLRHETLHYARTGAATIPRRLAADVERRGGRILLGHAVTALRSANDRVNAVVVADGSSGPLTLDCDHCISTMPLPDLARALDAPPSVLAAAERLVYRALVVHGLVVRRPRCLEGHYLYTRERRFHRVSEPKNAGLTVTPDDHTTLLVETTCERGDDVWEDDPALRDELLADLAAEGICRADDVVDRTVLRCATAYPVPLLGFETAVDDLQRFVDTRTNLRTAGRQGTFSALTMHRAMRSAADAVASLVERP